MVVIFQVKILGSRVAHRLRETLTETCPVVDSGKEP